MPEWWNAAVQCSPSTPFNSCSQLAQSRQRAPSNCGVSCAPSSPLLPSPLLQVALRLPPPTMVRLLPSLPLICCVTDEEPTGGSPPLSSPRFARGSSSSTPDSIVSTDEKFKDRVACRNCSSPVMRSSNTGSRAGIAHHQRRIPGHTTQTRPAAAPTAECAAHCCTNSHPTPAIYHSPMFQSAGDAFCHPVHFFSRQVLAR